MISLGVKENKEVDELVESRVCRGTIIDPPGVKQGYYGAMFADPDGHKFNFLVC